jgi:hypothetical protein
LCCLSDSKWRWWGPSWRCTALTPSKDPKPSEMAEQVRINIYTEWFKKIDSISYVYISCTIHGMWMIYITFETEGPKFSNTTDRALA